MKKIFSILTFVALSTFVISCSSDSSSSSSSNTFNYTYEGNAVTISNISAQKSENSLVVSGTASDGQAIEFTFDKFGNLGTAESFSLTSFDFVDTYNYQNYNSNYFTFNLISIDESAKRLKVSFSGNLYEEATSLSSNSVTVSGDFDVKYTDVTPTVPGLEVYAKIGGQDWYSTNSYTNNGNSFDDFILRELSSDENMISLGFDSTNNGPGTYNFTPSTSTNFVKLSKFNTTNLTYTDYNCTGSVIVSSKTSAGFIGYIIEGTYSFTATNPSNSSQTIQVTNGRFKTYYSW
jgi:hypothetical protein